jgi:hypothetical protein
MIQIFNGRGRALGQDAQDAVYLQVSVRLREHLHHFKGARLGVFLAIALHSNAEGWAWPSLAALKAETGYNVQTISQALSDLCVLTIDGERVLLAVQQRTAHGTFAANRYLLFPSDADVARYAGEAGDPAAQPPLDVPPVVRPTVETMSLDHSCVVGPHTAAPPLDQPCVVGPHTAAPPLDQSCVVGPHTAAPPLDQSCVVGRHTAAPPLDQPCVVPPYTAAPLPEKTHGRSTMENKNHGKAAPVRERSPRTAPHAVDRSGAAPPPHTEHEAVSAYRATFGRSPTEAQIAAIAASVTDLDRWRRVLDDWQTNAWRAQSVGKMLDRYRHHEQEHLYAAAADRHARAAGRAGRPSAAPTPEELARFLNRSRPDQSQARA